MFGKKEAKGGEGSAGGSSRLEAGRAAVVAGSITGNQVSVTLLFCFKKTYLQLRQQRSHELRG